MALAVNYRRWILDVFRPFLGKRIVEVGAGLGTFSQLVLETGPEWLDAVEPSPHLFPRLAALLPHVGSNRFGRAHQGTLEQSLEYIRRSGTPDSVVYVNVLEHIEDDVSELRTARSLLPPGGHLLIFAPAHRWLMGSMDHEFGHYRRYTEAELVRKCQTAGFAIRRSSYFDMLGILPWWIKYRLLQSKTMEPSAVRYYDRYVVPVSRFLERAITPPLGRNLIVVGQKP